MVNQEPDDPRKKLEPVDPENMARRASARRDARHEQARHGVERTSHTSASHVNGHKPSVAGGYAHATVHPRRAADRFEVHEEPGKYTHANRSGARHPHTNTAVPTAAHVSTVRPRRSRKRIVIALVVAAVLAIGIGVWNVMRPISLTVDGQQISYNGTKTPQGVFDSGVVTGITPGNLVAVDGSTITQGEGDKFEVTVNGQQVSADNLGEKLSDGDILQYSNGDNVTEPYTDSNERSIGYKTKDTGNGPIHVVKQRGVKGTEVTRTGQMSGITTNVVTQQPQDLLLERDYVHTNQKIVALTFDDGPWDTTTQEILDLLKQYNAKATFFEVGTCIKEHPDLTKEIVANGNQVGTHTWDHAAGSGQGVSLDKMTKKEQRQEVEKGFQAIADALGVSTDSFSHVMRAPGGNFDTSTFKNLSDLITADIGWNIDTEDWRRPGKDYILKQIKSATPGNVILMHDGGGDRSQTVAALKEALPYLVQQGYTFVTIDELMQYPMDTTYEPYTGQ